MGIQERREREKEELRQKIVDAARELFADKGYEAVSMRMIARRIEYSPTAIYLHFRDKDALFQEICDVDFLALAGEFRSIGQIADPVERMEQIGLLYMEFGRTRPQHYRLMFMTPHPRIPLHDCSLARRGNPEEDAYDFLRRTVQEAIDAGRLRPELTDAEQVAQLLWSGVHGVVSLHIAKANDEWIEMREMPQTAQLMVRTMTRGICRDPG